MAEMSANPIVGPIPTSAWVKGPSAVNEGMSGTWNNFRIARLTPATNVNYVLSPSVSEASGFGNTFDGDAHVGGVLTVNFKYNYCSGTALPMIVLLKGNPTIGTNWLTQSSIIAARNPGVDPAQNTVTIEYEFDTAVSADNLMVGVVRPGSTTTGTGVTGWKADALTATYVAPAVPTAPTISTPALPTFTVGTPADLQLVAAGTTPITWTVTAGALPAGVTMDTAGLLAGTPTTAGPYSVTITATNNVGSSPATYSGTVLAAPTAPTISTPALPTFMVGTPVDLQLVAAGTTPITWTVTAGALPAGVTMDTAGLLAGTPTTAGPYSVTITATNNVGSSPATYSGTVDAAPVFATLGMLVAAYLGRETDTKLVTLADIHGNIVTEYVRGYTRGRGFGDYGTGDPNRALLAVIVSATARLAANPEQVTAYTAGDYSERPAILAGWTIPELGVLRRHRVVAA